MFHTFILILHVFGSSIVLGVVFFSVAAMIKPPATLAQLDRLGFVGRFGMWASGWQFVTGVIMYLLEPTELNHNPLFWIKIGLYVVEGTLASVLLTKQVRRIRASLTQQQTPPARGLMMTLVIHAMLILAIVALGVMIVEQ